MRTKESIARSGAPKTPADFFAYVRARHLVFVRRAQKLPPDARQFPPGEGRTTRLWAWRLGPGYLRTELPQLTRRLRAATTPEAAHRVLMSVRGLGGSGFTAFQIYLDLCWGRILPFGEDEWALVGPGAKEGLTWMGVPPTDESVRKLWAEQPEDLPGPRLSLCNIQYALCGAQKYWRGWSRSGHFDLAQAGPLDPELWPPALLDQYVRDTRRPVTGWPPTQAA